MFNFSMLFAANATWDDDIILTIKFDDSEVEKITALDAQREYGRRIVYYFGERVVRLYGDK